MAKNEEVTVPASTWTELTDSDVSAITFQSRTDHGSMYIAATVDSVAPTGNSGSYYGPLEGEYLLTLAVAFPGVSGANRVWAYMTEGGEVFVSHA